MLEMYSDNDGVEGTPDEPPEDLELTPDLSTDVYLNAKWLGGDSFIRNKTLVATQLDARTRIQFSIHVGMKWSSTVVKLRSSLSTS